MSSARTAGTVVEQEIETAVRPSCEYPLWRAGRVLSCRQVIGVHTWRDVRGETHHACYRHVVARMHRYPAADPHEEHVRAGVGDGDCRACEAAWEGWTGA